MNRGVDKRKIFLNSQDYLRFIHDLFEFNDKNRVNTTFRAFQKTKNKYDLVGRTNKKKRELLVDIHAFCLMPNHYHLLLSPKIDNGISLFMRKLNMGFAKYFNQKYERTGTLFERRYRSVPIVQEEHFLHIPYYIHLNPLDLVTPTWRQRQLNNPDKAIEFLENYRWSSYLDYIGRKNFPSVTNRNFLSKVLGNVDNYRKETIEWIGKMDYLDIKDITLE